MLKKYDYNSFVFTKLDTHHIYLLLNQFENTIDMHQSKLSNILFLSHIICNNVIAINILLQTVSCIPLNIFGA